MSGNSRQFHDYWQKLAGGLEGAIAHSLQNNQPALLPEQIGRVTSLGGGVAQVQGFSGVRSEEVLEFSGGALGMAMDLRPGGIGVILLDDAPELGSGHEVRRTKRVLETPVGFALLGRVVDALGRPLDNKGAIQTEAKLPMERPAPRIMDRAPVTVPLHTGIKVIDAMIPVGRGQRELILGDRQTGKTAIAVDTILNQAGNDVVCIYCAIGKRSSAVARVVDTLAKRGGLDYTIVMASSEEDPPGIVYSAPYAATSMAEFFMEQGRDVLIVYDDLTRHARAYREISLLMRRPPGREAFPGDIFYIHSRLLERSTHLVDELGGGSLTALPIIETEAENLSAYIPTNLVSITDGQIYLSPRHFQKGLLPAVDVGLSVSRVGGKTQLKAFRTLAGDLRLSYSQFEELEGFARFGTRLDQESRSKLERGQRVRAALRQPQYEPMRVAEQIAVLVAVNAGIFDGLDPADVPKAERAVRHGAALNLPEICREIEAGKDLGDDMHSKLMEEAKTAVEGWRGGNGADH